MLDNDAGDDVIPERMPGGIAYEVAQIVGEQHDREHPVCVQPRGCPIYLRLLDAYVGATR